MRLLAIETATAVTALAAVDDEASVERIVDDRRRHTEVLAPAIVELLAARGWRAADLDGIVVDVGPGLFTGLRVGLAAAKGLSVATGVGLFGVTSTDALAAAAAEAEVSGSLTCVVDARRREVFAATYDCAPDGAVPRGDVAVLTPAALAESLRDVGPRTLVGDGAARYRDVLGAVPGVALRDDLVVPSPGAAARLARRRAAGGEAAHDHRDVRAWYLREADAVANFAVRDAGP